LSFTFFELHRGLLDIANQPNLTAGYHL